MAGHTYRVIVEGELSERLAPAFAGMEFSFRDGDTALTGYLRDQPELQALLRRIADLGLTLLEARAVDEVGEPEAVTGTLGTGTFDLKKRNGGWVT